MNSLLEYGVAIQDVRDAINQLEIKGNKNATIILYCNKKCDEMIQSINDALKPQPADTSKGDEPDERNSDAT